MPQGQENAIQLHLAMNYYYYGSYSGEKDYIKKRAGIFRRMILYLGNMAIQDLGW